MSNPTRKPRSLKLSLSPDRLKTFMKVIPLYKENTEVHHSLTKFLSFLLNLFKMYDELVEPTDVLDIDIIPHPTNGTVIVWLGVYRGFNKQQIKLILDNSNKDPKVHYDISSRQMSELFNQLNQVA